MPPTNPVSNIKHLIQYIQTIHPLQEREIEDLSSVFASQRLRKNELFLKAGEPLTRIGFNLNGIFRYYYNDFEGNEKTKYFVEENDFILSLSSLIEKSPSLYSIQALEDCEILTAPAAVIDAMITDSPAWQSIYRHILEKTYVIKEKREAEFLMCDAKERYLNFVRDFPMINRKVKLHTIASYLGIAPESLSRIRSQTPKS